MIINSLTLNNASLDIEDGVVYSDKATEELDTATIQLRNVAKLTLKPFDPVEITLGDSSVIYMVVNTWVEENASFDTSLYNYTIQLISETKKLERVQLPNLCITQPIGITTKRKYSRYTNQVLTQYINKVYPDLDYSDELSSLFSTETAIEEQFNNPTAKEFLNQILSKYGKIVKVSNNVIDYVDIATKCSSITESKLFTNNPSQSIDDFYNGIRVDMENVETDDSSVITEIVGVRTDDALLTTENAYIELKHNINYLKRVVCYLKATSETAIKDQVIIIYGDNYKLIKEKQQWDLLYSSNSPSIVGSTYKRCNLYFTRGSNRIEGLSFNENTWLMNWESVNPCIMNILAWIISDSGSQLTVNSDLRELKFEVTYSSLDGDSYQSNKVVENEGGVLKDNQTSSIVDANRLAKYEKENINRLGNDAKTITARYDSLSELPSLMSCIGDYILAEREIVYHTDYIDFKGILYKDYVKKNIYYGLNARRRSTQLIPLSDAVIRKDLEVENYQFSFTNDTSQSSNDLYTARYIIGKIAAMDYVGTTYATTDTDRIYNTYNIYQEDFKPIQISYGYFNPANTYIRLELDVKKADTSVLVNFKFNDNITAGSKISDSSDTNGYGMKYVNYADSYGEVSSFIFRMYDGNILTRTYTAISNYANDLPEATSALRNLVNSNYLVYYKRINRVKDNMEILDQTFQFNILGDGTNIFVTDRFIDMTPFFLKYKTVLYVYLSRATFDKYNYDNVTNLGDYKKLETSVCTIDYSDFLSFVNDGTLFNRLKLYASTTINFNDYESWCLADGDGNVYIAVNKPSGASTLPTTIYLNHITEN